jgi:hypothetical protein
MSFLIFQSFGGKINIDVISKILYFIAKKYNKN